MNNRTVVIVQARWGSSRLQGKVLRNLNGQTVLRRVLGRCASIDGVATVCCAVPSGSADDCIAEEATRCGVAVFRGSELDVLNRYYQAALQLNAAFVVRVTSDCPLLDPAIATEVLRLATAEVGAYCCNNLPRTWPHGLDCEAFPFELLQRAEREAKLPAEREHVTPFIRNCESTRKLVVESPDRNLARHRWTLDTDKDLQFLRSVFERMPEGGKNFDYRCPLSVVEEDPELCLLSCGQNDGARDNTFSAGEGVLVKQS